MTEVHFINVGYGDAALILKKESGGQPFTMLVDCGGETVGTDDPTGYRITAAGYLKSLDIGHINIVLLSHLHLDHSGGILSIAENFTVGELWTNYIPDRCFWDNELEVYEGLLPGPVNLIKNLRIYTTALKMLYDEKTIIRTYTSGFTKTCPFGGIRMITGNPVLYERQSEILNYTFAKRGTNDLLCELDGFINNTSLRAELSLPGAELLFAGDVYASEWEKEDIQRADIVKLPHHGHADSLSEAIAKKLDSLYTIISVSNTRTDNCPNPRIIEMLEKSGSRVLFTDAVRAPGCPDGKKHRSIIFSINDKGIYALDI